MLSGRSGGHSGNRALLGALSESFESYVPDVFFPSPMSIMGGAATMAGPLLYVYRDGTVWGGDGMFGVSDGGKAIQLQGTSIVFAEPVRRFGAYWNTGDLAPGPMHIEFFGTGGELVGSADLARTPAPSLGWNGWEFTPSVKEVRLHWDSHAQVMDGLQAEGGPQAPRYVIDARSGPPYSGWAQDPAWPNSAWVPHFDSRFNNTQIFVLTNPLGQPMAWAGADAEGVFFYAADADGLLPAPAPRGGGGPYDRVYTALASPDGNDFSVFVPAASPPSTEPPEVDPGAYQLVYHLTLFAPSNQNQAPVAVAGPDQTVECTGALTEVALDGGASSDTDGDPITLFWSVPSNSGAQLDDPTRPNPMGLFPKGSTLVTLTVADARGGVAVDDVLITVQDTTAPVVVCTTDKTVLWPPNHRMESVRIDLAVSDACDAPASLAIQGTIASSEPDDSNGDGTSTGDVMGLDGYTVPRPITGLSYDPASRTFHANASLRAERDGSGSGRTYSISFTVSDQSGNVAIASCVVVVPHDKRRAR
jgi:hypothetical protein